MYFVLSIGLLETTYKVHWRLFVELMHNYAVHKLLQQQDRSRSTPSSSSFTSELYASQLLWQDFSSTFEYMFLNCSVCLSTKHNAVTVYTCINDAPSQDYIIVQVQENTMDIWCLEVVHITAMELTYVMTKI